jgi:hypothetical protein
MCVMKGRTDGTQRRRPRGVLVATHFCLLVNRTRPPLKKIAKNSFLATGHIKPTPSATPRLRLLKRKNVQPTNAKAPSSQTGPTQMNLETGISGSKLVHSFEHMPTCHNRLSAHLLRTRHDHAPQHKTNAPFCRLPSSRTPHTPTPNTPNTPTLHTHDDLALVIRR